MSSKNEKLFVCDLDGVLVQNNGEIREEDLKAIKNFILKGGIFSICTGRLDQDIQYVEEKIGVKGQYRISQNGAVIKDKDGNVLFHKTIHKSYIDTINTILSQYNIRTEINDIDHRYYPTPRNPENIAEFVDTSIVKNDLFEYVRQNIEPTIYLNFGEEKIFNKIKKEIQQKLSDNVNVVQTSLNSLEIFSKEASKGNALCYISSLLTFEKQNIFAAGDAESDLTMFPHVGVSFAVGDDCEEKVKESADYYVKTIDELLNGYI